MEANCLDRRSFRVFEVNGDLLLFDRSTGTTSSIDPVAFSVLAKYQDGATIEEALCQSKVASDSDARHGMAAFTEALTDRGFFHYDPVDPTEQEALMEDLWRHKPRRVQLLMAQGCNLGCRYCYAWRNGSNQKGTLMPWEIAKATVDHLIRNSGSRPNLQVTFFGGEPLLNYEVMRQIVEYCRGIEKTTPKRFTFELITNGTLLTAEITDWIVSEKFLLFVSIDGWKEMHNYNRPSMSGDDMYDTILKNALYANERYKATGLAPMKVRANLTNRFHDSAKVGEYLASLGFTVIGVGAIEPLPHGDPSPSALTEDQVGSS